jgi:hypothetical protein
LQRFYFNTHEKTKQGLSIFRDYARKSIKLFNLKVEVRLINTYFDQANLYQKSNDFYYP